MSTSSVTLRVVLLCELGEEAHEGQGRAMWLLGAQEEPRQRQTENGGYDSLKGRNEFQRTQRYKSPCKRKGSELNYLNVQIC